MRGDEFARRHALQRGVDGGQQHRRPVAALYAREPRQRGHALRHDAGVRRHPVVRQTIPGRKFHDFDVGPEERKRARQRRHALAVAADHGQRNRRRIGRAAMARARSASTSPSAPSATCASVSACPGFNNSAGDFAICHREPLADGNSRNAAEQRRVDLRRSGFSATDPGENLLIGNVEPGARTSSSSASLKIFKLRVGKAAEHKIHLADAAMPGAKQQPPPPRIQPFARNPASSHAILQRQKPGGCRVRGLYRGPGAYVSVCFAQASIASANRASQHAADAPARAQPAIRRPHQPARRRAEAGAALCPAARPRGAARRRSAVSLAFGRHRPPRAAEAQRGAGRARSSPSR